MALNFNQYPYNDDYLNDTENNTHTKNFHRILFKPGVAVQARELTQTQSILQDQIRKFGDHIFKNHSVVYGGGFTTNFAVKFVKLEELDVNNQIVDVSKFVGGIVNDIEGNIEAKVIHAISDSPPVLILSYMSKGEFSSGDTIILKNSELTAKVIAIDSSQQPATGFSSVVSVDNGVFYIDGFFVDVFKQTIAIDEFSNAVSARIGLSIEESIISSDEDTSLLDPALGASNFQAPGADRYKIYLRLTKKPLELDADTTFIEILRIEDGKLLKAVKYTQYSEIDKYFARRTFDTNGNFIVDKFTVNVEDNPQDANTYLVNLGPGKAYVNGFIVENQSDLKIVADKARSNNSVQNKSVFLNYGNYLYINNANGVFDFNSYQPVDIHVVKSANSSNTLAYQATLAATAKVKNMKFFGFSDAANSKSYVYETYLVDIQGNVASGEAKNFTIGNGGNPATAILPLHFSEEDDAYKGVYLRVNDGDDAGDVLKIVSYAGSTRTATFERDFISIPKSTTNSFSLLFQTKDFESITSSNTTVTNGISDKSSYAHITPTSKNPAVENGDAYLRGTDDRGLVYELGNDFIVPNSLDNSEYYTWMKLSDQNIGTAMSVSNPSVFSFMGSPTETLTESSASENFIVVLGNGSLLPFNGDTNTVIMGATSSQATINAPSINGTSVDVYAKVKVNDGNEVNLSRKTKTLIQGSETVDLGSMTTVSSDANVKINLTTGQLYVTPSGFNSVKQSLFTSDVIRVKRVIDTGAPGTAVTQAMLNSTDYDIDNYFLFDNGQNDHYYDHASLKLYPNAPAPKGNLFVVFDYFLHEGNGYFDCNSYLGSIDYGDIPSYTNSKGDVYELRDCVDFRKTRTNGTKSFSVNQYGQKPTGIPVDGTPFETDYSYYLGRKDLLVVGKDNDFKLIQGNPSLNPVEPNQPELSMTIARFDLDPYTVRVTSDNRGAKYASIRIQTMIHKRWRMEDITLLEDRVTRVEYYTALNTLELATKNLQIPDETGSNRFKSGILTDNFTSYIVSNINSPDYFASIQTVKTRLFAVHNIQNFDLALKDTIKTRGVLDPSIKNLLDYSVDYDGDDAYVTLPYTKVKAAMQPYASSVVNVNPFSVIDIEGRVTLTPKFDAWVSSTKLPDIKFTLPVPQTNAANRLTTGSYQTVKGADKNSASGNLTITPENKDFDGFITDASLYPWIRGQQVQFLATGMLKNCPVSCYFDGKNVTDRVREVNTLWIDVANTVAANVFAAGAVISPKSEGDIVYKPTGTILYSTKANSYNVTVGSVTTTRQVYECSIVGDLDINKYVGSSNTIQSVYLTSAGVISSTIKGEGKLAKIERNSGRIVKLGTGTNANNIYINRFYPGQNTSIADGTTIGIIYEGVSNANTPIGDSSTVFAYDILSTREDDTNNHIILTCIQAHTDILPGISYNSLSASEKKNFVYNLKPGSHISTNKRGAVCGVFYLPKDTYHTGDRIFRIDNRVAENPGTDTTFAQTVFFASNLNYNKRGISIDIPPPPPPPPGPPPPPPCEGPFEVAGYASTTYSGGGKSELVHPSVQLDKSYAVSGFRLKWIGDELESRYVNNSLKTSYPTNVIEFDTDTIVYRTDDVAKEGLSWIFSKYLTVVKTYYYKDPKCGTKFKVKTFHDPVAQTFIFYKDEFPFGCFIKSVKVFFRSKPDDGGTPITCLISDTLNGVPTKAEMPHASKTLDPEDVKISENPAVWNPDTFTEFEFPVPVYVKPETMYSFILKTDTDEYEAYTARLGDLALPSSTTLTATDTPKQDFRISTTPYIGELFKSQNAITWTSDGNEDLMFEIKRCEFDISKNPKVEFVVPELLPQRKLGDHHFDYTYGANTDFAAGYTSNTNFLVDAFDVSTTDLTFTEAPIKYSYRATLNSTKQKEDFETFVSPGKYGSTNFQEILLDDGKGERVLTPNTVAGGAYSFSLYADMKSTDSKISPMISEVGLSLFGIQWKINDLGISNTDIKIVNGGSGYTGNPSVVLRRTSNNVTSNAIIGTDASLDVDVVGGVITNVRVLNPGSQYASTPIVEITDGTGTNAEIVVAGETSTVGGNGLVRYITQPVTLEQGFEAGDLRVYYTAYRPVNSNIYIYYKILNSNDTQNFDDSDWQLMTTISGGSTFSKKRGQLFEYIAAPYVEPNIGVPSNKVTYESKVNGLVYNQFSKFAIKVVMSSQDPTLVPYLEDMRAIALLPIG